MIMTDNYSSTAQMLTIPTALLNLPKRLRFAVANLIFYLLYYNCSEKNHIMNRCIEATVRLHKELSDKLDQF